MKFLTILRKKPPTANEVVRTPAEYAKMLYDTKGQKALEEQKQAKEKAYQNYHREVLAEIATLASNGETSVTICAHWNSDGYYRIHDDLKKDGFKVGDFHSDCFQVYWSGVY